MDHSTTQVVQVAPPRDRYDDKMARARNFCADHSGGAECSSAPPTYESGGVASYRSGAMPYEQQPSTGWAEAAPRPEPVNVPMAESSASTQGGAFVAPVLSSPAQKVRMPEVAVRVHLALTRIPTPTLTLTLTTRPSPSPYPGAQSFLSLLHKAQYEGGQPLPAADELPTLLTGFFGRQVRSRYSMAD